MSPQAPVEAAPSPARGSLVCAALLAVLLVEAVAGVDYLPTHDGPQHVFSLHAANHLDDPETGWGIWLEPALPLTNHGFALLFGPLDAWLGWRPALRLSLAAMVLLWASGAFVFARTLRPERSWLGLALATAGLQWSLYMGLFSFYVSSAFGLWILALGFGVRRWSPRVRGALSLLLLAQAVMHVFPAVLTGALLTLLALFRSASDGRLRELGRCALMGAPAAAVALGLLRVGLGTLGDYNEGSAGWSAELPSWWTLGRCFLGGPAWRSWPLNALALLAPVLAWATRGRGISAEDRALLVGGLLCLAAAFLLPFHIRAWDFFSVRFLPLAVASLLLALPLEGLRAPAARRAAAVALAGYAFAAGLWGHAYGRDLALRSAQALAGLDAPLHRDGPRLPVILDPYLGLPAEPRLSPMPYAVPLLNLGQLYAASQGGIVPYSFTGNPHLHAVVLRPEARRVHPRIVDRRYAEDLAMPEHHDDELLRQSITSYVGADGADYQDVILWGRPSDGDHLLALGFEPEWRRGGLLIARFHGCPLEIRLPAGAPVAGHTVIELGWSPARAASHRFALGGAPHQPDGAIRLPIRQTPCGSVWFRFEDPSLTCEGADSERRVVVPSTQATPSVECRVRRSGTVSELARRASS